MPKALIRAPKGHINIRMSWNQIVALYVYVVFWSLVDVKLGRT